MAYRVLLEASTQPTLQPADDPSVAVAATPPKKRRFASAWAKTLRNPLEIDPNEGPLVRSNSSTVANAMPRDVKDVDDEFDRQFELPKSIDTAPRWKCPVDFAEFQRLLYNFPDFRPNRQSPSSSCQSPSSDSMMLVSTAAIGTTSDISASRADVEGSSRRRARAASWAMGHRG